MTLIANKQEAETMKGLLPSETVVDSEIGTDFVIQGVEKSRIFERKELRDFMHSIRDGRLFEQLKMLSDNKEEYEPFIIVEGLGFYDVQSRKWLNLKSFFETYPEKKLSFYEALVSFRAFGVGLVITVDKTDTALFLTYENTKLGKPKVKKEYPARPGFRRDWTIEQKRLYMLDCFGHETSKALVKNFSSVLDIICRMGLKSSDERIISFIADTKLASGRRIGNSKAKEIFQVLLTQ